MEQNKIISIMGSPGSGKTTTAAKLALELAGRKKNVVLVCCDPFTPVIPFLIPFPEEQVSIGTLLTSPSLTQKMILDSCLPIKESKYISLLGYRSGDSLMAYPQVTRERAVDFLVCLRYLADYILIDCSTVFEADVLSMVSLELCDQMVKIGTSNLRGISYFESRRVRLSDRRFQPEKQLMYLGNLKDGQEWESVAVQYGGVEGVLPHNPSLARQYDELTLFESLTGKEAVSYSEAIQNLAERMDGPLLETKTDKRRAANQTKPDEPGASVKERRQPTKQKERSKGGKRFSLSFRKNKGEF